MAHKEKAPLKHITYWNNCDVFNFSGVNLSAVFCVVSAVFNRRIMVKFIC